ncbi:MAG: pitrilysin family protein [Chitinophagales bacterium]|nr:pitrilysin family protein [Chitinophagales bacterium]
MRIYINLSLFLLAGVLNLPAQTREFTAGGIKVIFKPSPKEVISVRMFVDGGTANYSKEQEGIEALALMTAIQGGTKTLDKIAFQTEAEKIGAHFASATTYDFGSIEMTCLGTFWNKSWELFTDAILNPAFDEKEFNIIKEQLIATAKNIESDPDAHLRTLAMENVFEGKNYSKQPDGTSESLQKLTVAETKNYYTNTIGMKRCFIVVVGNVQEEDLKKKIEASLVKMREGTPATKEPRQVIRESGVHIEDRDIATNYLRGLFTAPAMSDKDAVALRMAMNILQDKFFVELRTKRSLSYAPGAFYSTGVINSPYSVLYITTQDPAQSMQVMVDLINEIKVKGFTDIELKNTQLSFLTNFYMGQETSAAQSQTLGMMQVAGDWKLAETFSEKVNALTLDEMNKAFAKYTNAIYWTYLGKKDAVKETDFKQLKYDKKNTPY